jgi:hypothetical protein
MEKPKLSWSGIALISGIILSSCMPEVEMPLASETPNASVESAEAVTGGENLRKFPGAYNYMEEFDNQIFHVPVEGLSFPQGLYPGSGEGSATRFGKGKKSYSFFNQLAQFDEDFELITEGAPVTDIFGDELLGMDLKDIPSNVSSITTDGTGNAIWFENIENRTTYVSPEEITFQATIKVVGGNGRFEKAFGEGVVEGYFNPSDGTGKSKVTARINY